MAARQRSPRLARPRSRAILVDAPVSSMKTSFSGSRSGCPSNQRSRRAFTSGLHVRAFLLRRMRRLFLNVMLRFLKKVQTVAGQTDT